MVSQIRLHIFHDLHRNQSNRRLFARARQMSACLKGVAQVCVCCNVGRVCPKTEDYADESEQQFSASAPPASLSLLGNFEVEQTSTAVPSAPPGPDCGALTLTWLPSALTFVHSLQLWKSLLFCLKQSRTWLKMLILNVWLNSQR